MRKWSSEKQRRIEEGLSGWTCDETGLLFTRRGKEASRDSKYPSGYLVTNICGFTVPQHHIVWFLTHGVWAGELDHIDRDKENNSPSNLREVTRSVNNINREPLGSIGIRGVTLHKATGKYQVRIACGAFKRSRLVNTLEEAACLREQWEDEVYASNQCRG